MSFTDWILFIVLFEFLTDGMISSIIGHITSVIHQIFK